MCAVTRARGGPRKVKSRPRGLAPEVMGVFILAVAGVCLASLTAENGTRPGPVPEGGAAGIIGGAIAGSLRLVMGQSAYVVPLVIAGYGLLVLIGRLGGRAARWVGVTVLGLSASGFAQLFLCGDVSMPAELRVYLSGWNGGPYAGAGGGLIGALIYGTLVLGFGKTGAVVMLVFLIVVGLVLALNLSPIDAAKLLVKTLAFAARFVYAAARAMVRAGYAGIRGAFQFLLAGDEGAPGREGAARRDTRGGPQLSGELSTEATTRRKIASFSVTPEGDGTFQPRVEPPAPQEAPERSSASGWGTASQTGGPFGHRDEQGRRADGEDRAGTFVNRREAAGNAGKPTAAQQLDAGSGRVRATEPVQERSEGSEIDKYVQLKLIEDRLMMQLPPLSILKAPQQGKKGQKASGDVQEQIELLESTLASFGVKAKVVDVSRGPMVTRFEVQPALGVKVSKIVNLADDLALAFAAPRVRIEAPIPGKAAVGIEVPNREKAMVTLREVLEAPEFQAARSKLTVAVGKDIAGQPVVADLTDMLHLLVAGATGSGKSVCLNALIASLLFKARPNEVKLLMIDPKKVELSVFDGIPHLIGPVVTDPKRAAAYLKWVVDQMEMRYRLFQIAGVRNIDRYNELCTTGVLEDIFAEARDQGVELPQEIASAADEPEEDGEGRGEAQAEGEEAPRRRGVMKPLPYIVVIVDELADLMMVAQADVEAAIARLAFMARAAGIHLVIATQRPSADIVTGIIKANIPSRIAFAVSSHIDSRIILDTGGAEKLLGKGDMLFHPIGAPKPFRVQGAYVSEAEINALVKFLREQGGPKYEHIEVPDEDAQGDSMSSMDDELFADAARLIVESKEASISKLQRRFRIGYARAARLIDMMETSGIVGPYEGSRPRKVLVTLSELEMMLSVKGGGQSVGPGKDPD